jgi:hypothetical protein
MGGRKGGQKPARHKHESAERSVTRDHRRSMVQRTPGAHRTAFPMAETQKKLAKVGGGVGYPDADAPRVGLAADSYCLATPIH